MFKDNKIDQKKLLSRVESENRFEVEVIFNPERMPNQNPLLDSNKDRAGKHLFFKNLTPKQFIQKGPLYPRCTRKNSKGKFCLKLQFLIKIQLEKLSFLEIGEFVEINKNNLMKILKYAHIPILISKYSVELENRSNFSNYFDVERLAKNLQFVNRTGNHSKYIVGVEGRPALPPCKTTQLTSLVVLGGWNDLECDVVERFDANRGEWTATKVQFKRKRFCCAFIYGKVLIIGGVNREIINTVESYEPKLWSKTPLAPMHDARSNFTTVSDGTYVYAMGGQGKKWNVLSSVERFNPLLKKWSMLRAIPTARYCHGAAILNGKIYVIGGTDENFKLLAKNECLTLSTNSWSTCAPMQEKRNCPGIVAVQGFIFAVGGHDGGSRLFTIEKYDPELNQWTYVLSMSSPLDCMSCVNFEEKLICTGGYSDNGVVNTVQQYDPQNDQWTTMPGLNNSRYYHNTILMPFQCK